MLLSHLLKRGKGKSRQKISDHRPIGLISTIAKLLKQILLPRLTEVLSHALSPDQTGGWLGADAAALYVWELLMLRAAGQCQDAVNGKATTWLAFLDLESFFDRVSRNGLLYKFWNAGVRGKAFLSCCSSFCVRLVTNARGQWCNWRQNTTYPSHSS